MQNNQQQEKTSFPQMEEDVLKFWEDNKIFEKSVEKDNPKGDYVFYDGPPFATGTPHYGHIVASTMKDAVPRYWTMKGFRVERRWGWDCHGLPIENIVEKEIGSKAKKDIEEKIGVAKFNEMCRSKVSGYVEEWKKVMAKLGRWADMENSYKTMDLDFMESVWHVFKVLYDKGLIYEGYRSMHICPRCETTLSQSEVSEGYKDVKDLSCIAKFELIREPNTYVLAWTTTPWTLIGNVALAVGEDIDYVKVQTPQPPLSGGLREFPPDKGGKGGLLGSKVKPESKQHDVIEVKDNFVNYIIAKDIFEELYNKDDKNVLKLAFNLVYAHTKKEGEETVQECKIVKEFKGKNLIGKKYKPIFNYYSNNENLENKENGWKIYGGDFVTTEEGTGVVHIAPAFGEDDMNLGKKYNLPFVQHIGMDGVIKKEATDFAGMSVKPLGDHTKTDIEIIKYLAHNNLLFSKEKYEHSYPHCWRCDTPLLNYATSSWFVSITKIKDQMLQNAKDINWSPQYIKDGRFGNWLEGARDWSISRQRFWASVIPIWKCEGSCRDEALPRLKSKVSGSGGCGNIKVIGSIKELEDLSGEKVTDIHKHVVDEITFKCEKCDGEMKRIPDVLDTWFDSGSMPYAQAHYPFENKEKFEKNFPAEFIAEGIDQTRCWFYYMHAIATGIKNTRAYNNVIVNGIVLAEDGKKMSKKLQNYPDPMNVLGHYGADALRFYLLTSPVMVAENLNFSESGVVESLRKNIMLLWNVYKFYEIYADDCGYTTASESPSGDSDGAVNCSAGVSPQRTPASGELQPENILDKWILAKLNQLISEVTDGMDKYDLPKASRPITDFIDDFSTWYLRRSRDRFKGEDENDKNSALKTTGYVLLQLSKVMAPFMPFISEQLWQKVTGNNFEDENKSVHLEKWVEARELNNNDLKLLEEMKAVRTAVKLGLAARDLAKIKVRQPLSLLYVDVREFNSNNTDLTQLLKDEVNVQKVENIAEQGGPALKRERGLVEIKEGHYKGKYSDDKDGDNFVSLKLDITPELLQLGYAREIVRTINNLRKDAGLSINDSAEIYYTKDSELDEIFEKHGKDILKDTLCVKYSVVDMSEVEMKKEVKIGEKKVLVGIKY